MHKLSAMLMVLLAVALRAQAQDTPKAEVFTGYAFMSAGFPFSTDPAAGNARGVLNGWNFSAAVNPNRWVGVVADVRRVLWFCHQDHDLQAGELRALHRKCHRHSSHMYTFTAGPQVSIRHESMTVFAHALFGDAHIREDLIADVTPSASVSSTNFAFLAGGGVDIALSHRFALRIQPDYLKTEILSRSQTNFRVSTGLVFRL